MSASSLEQQARHKLRIAIQMLSDAQVLYTRTGRTYGNTPLTAEALGPMIEELAARVAEADRLSPLVP